MNGCHVIKFCDKVIASEAHVLGLHPLHYENSYYEYGARAIETICMNYSDNRESDLLNDLRTHYSDKFALLYEKLCLQNNLFWSNNALNFAKNLHFDTFGQENFIKWLKRNKNSKISVLVAHNVAGQIFLSALNKYNIKPILVSNSTSFGELSKEDFELCRQSDVVICANVHAANPPEQDGIRATLITELLGGIL